VGIDKKKFEIMEVFFKKWFDRSWKYGRLSRIYL